MTCIFKSLVTNADVRRGVIEVVMLFMTPKGTQADSELEEIVNTQRIMNTENTFAFWTKERCYVSFQFTKSWHTIKMTNNNVPRRNCIRKKAFHIPICSTSHFLEGINSVTSKVGSSMVLDRELIFQVRRGLVVIYLVNL